MQQDLDFLKNEAANRGMCKYAADTFDGIVDKESAVTKCVHPTSIPYMADSTYQGWGLSLDYITDEYWEYINGYTCNVPYKNGLTVSGQLWVSCDDPIMLNTFIAFFLDCNSVLSTIRTSSAMHVSNRSNLEITLPLKSSTNIYLYDESTIDLGELKEGQKVMVYVYGDVPTEGRINYTDNGGVISIRKRSIEQDAYDMKPNND